MKSPFVLPFLLLLVVLLSLVKKWKRLESMIIGENAARLLLTR